MFKLFQLVPCSSILYQFDCLIPCCSSLPLQLAPSLQLAPVFPVCCTLFQQSVSACVMFFYLLPACAPCPVLFQHVLHSSSLCTLSRVVPACSTFFQLCTLSHVVPACSTFFQLACLVPGCFTPFTDKLSALYMLIQLPVFPLFPFCFSFNGPVQQYKEHQTRLQQCWPVLLLKIRDLLLFCKFTHYYWFLGVFLPKGLTTTC